GVRPPGMRRARRHEDPCVNSTQSRRAQYRDTAGVSIPIILDCDPGHDDAIALLLALASPELELLGVTTVHGNQTLEKTTANALRVLDLAGRPDVPVAAGADRPLARALRSPRWVRARTGRSRGSSRSPRTSTATAASTGRLSRLPTGGRWGSTP